MVAPSNPDLVRARHSLMLFQRSNRTANTSRTVARKRLRGSGIIPSVTLVPVLVPVEEYAHVITPSFNLAYVDSPDVHGKHHGERCGGFGDDTSRRFLIPRGV